MVAGDLRPAAKSGDSLLQYAPCLQVVVTIPALHLTGSFEELCRLETASAPSAELQGPSLVAPIAG